MNGDNAIAGTRPDPGKTLLNHLVAGRDHPRVGRIGLLGHDQLGELVGDVGVRALERGAEDLAGRAVDRRAGLVGRLEGAAVDALEVVGAVEVRERDLGEVEGAAVGVAADHPALVVDRHLLQLAGREAVLLQQIDLRIAVRIGELGDSAGAVDSCTSPSETPLTVTPVSVRVPISGSIWPFGPKM